MHPLSELYSQHQVHEGITLNIGMLKKLVDRRFIVTSNVLLVFSFVSWVSDVRCSSVRSIATLLRVAESDSTADAVLLTKYW